MNHKDRAFPVCFHFMVVFHLLYRNIAPLSVSSPHHHLNPYSSILHETSSSSSKPPQLQLTRLSPTPKISPPSSSFNRNPPSMRIRLIRKAYPPPSLSSPSPPPQSGLPPLHHHTPHLLQPSDISPPDKNRQPSDLSIAAASGTNGVDSLDQTKNTRGGSNQDPMVGDGEEEEADAEEKPLVSTTWR